MAKFTPKTEREVRNLLPDGVYTATVREAEETKSKASGEPMFAITLEVFDEDRSVKMKDWLLINNSKMAFKLRHFCYSAGLDVQYESGVIEDVNMVLRNCNVRIETEDNKSYGVRNRVVDYIAPSEGQRTKVVVEESLALDEKLKPFPPLRNPQATHVLERDHRKGKRDQTKDVLKLVTATTPEPDDLDDIPF